MPIVIHELMGEFKALKKIFWDIEDISGLICADAYTCLTTNETHT
jgi:hypothetical protein